ncbi:ileal sodium/bile acid cotransporter [Eurytemora carolleeae]|uniref:ileal sodium/bile acid cotransporter n=1 Tax=Eurytemora carolleeae TaxID=1294199 RepID=UPI000C7767F3|nr:ileal sodium/bile acid cotransporter [Eurytemora carolleeae]XP_023322071.1 ileal sodium/bile acid cotransporter [Eurytemora carolleeae]XP_023322072.1 ileal sodium/bile acid cotransporter [Eurytemora carolleeae]XP_023322073.1 ileal sodium/bile acid cotransporter [Eurytemora carolleeae]|eukprot:XP_023322070.1 ileal sodium/bile acid cotransporter-like [Eurytemora affinis]
MCPLYPLHILVLYCCMLIPLFLAVVQGAENLASWNLNFSVPSLGNGENKLREETSQTFDVLCFDCPQLEDEKYMLELKNQDPGIGILSYPKTGVQQDESGYLQLDITGYPEDFNISFNVTGTFLGFSKISAKVVTAKDKTVQEVGTPEDLRLTVTRSIAKKTASKIFGYSVAVLISFAYINMGCALDLDVMKSVLKRPIGPGIGFVTQFMFMPLCAFALTYVFPSHMPEMRLGLFVTGCSPGGGASNIWTVMFGGNLDLSVTMTAVSTFSAFFMMPIWMFALGEVIIEDTDIVVPYSKILTYGIMLIVPLTIGIAIKRFLPRVSAFMVKIMKPMALFLIVFILVCGIWSQFFMIQLISWRIALVGFGLPWLGFGFGCLFSKLCRRERKDIIAIAVETGIQNTGMAIFMLWFTLDHPAGDLAAVVPVAVATLTPFPLLAALLYYKLRSMYCPLLREVELEEMNKDGFETTQSLMGEKGLEPSIIKSKEDSNQNIKA